MNFIGTPPADILWDSHNRGESPWYPGGEHFFGGCLADLLGQSRIMCRAYAALLGEHGGAVEVGIPMGCINSVDHWYLQPRGHGLFLKAIDNILPALRDVVLRIVRSAAKDGSNPIGSDIPAPDTA